MEDFFGFIRSNELVGIRNHVLVLSISGLGNPLTERLTNCVKGTVPMYTPNGRGQVGEDKKQLERTLIGVSNNPNVSSVMIVSYDQQTADYFKEKIEVSGKSVETLSILNEKGTINATSEGMRKLTQMVIKSSEEKRQRVSISKLTVGLECGGSDLSSGKISNPTVGAASDFLINKGGTSIFSETVELIGGEKILANRAVNNKVGNKIISKIDSAFKSANEIGADVKSVNPVPENIQGGLETLEEKALGALMKTGKSKITDVLEYAEQPNTPGLFFMDTPFFSTESMTAMVAAGAQLILFTTGVGNNIGTTISPTIKVTGNFQTPEMMSEHIDVDISKTNVKSEKMEDRLEVLLDEMKAVCDGKFTNAEVLSEMDQAISRLSPSV